MEQIDALTGQRIVLASLVDWLTIGDASDRFRALEGPSGSGKTWLIRELEREVQQEFAVFILSGDPSGLSLDLFPFRRTLEVSYATQDAQAGLAELTGFLPGASFFQWSATYALNHTRTTQERLSGFLQPTERQMVAGIERFAAGRQLSLILDDLHAWDELSWKLLYELQTGNLTGASDSLRQARYLSVVTPEQMPRGSALFDKIRRPPGVKVLSLTYCKPRDIGAILRAFGTGVELPNTVLDDLYRITNGHLAVISQLVQYLNSVKSVDAVVNATSLQVACRDVIENRLRSYKTNNSALLSLLKNAATIGVSFGVKELACLTEIDESSIRDMLIGAIELNIVRGPLDADRFEFSHLIFQSILNETAKIPDTTTHRMFADCLRKLRPGDYRTRALHCELSDNHKGALEMRALDIIAAVRTRRLSPDEALSRCLDLGTVARHLRSIILAYASHDANDYEEAISLLLDIDPTAPPLLIVESEILLARCRVKRLETSEQLKAFETLAHVAELRDVERDVWQRASLTRVIALAFSGDIERAGQEARRFSGLLTKSNYDDDSSSTLHRLRARADIYLRPSTAEPSLQQAIEYFGPGEGSQGVAVDPLNYYIALNNMIGNQIMRGEFTDAWLTVEKCRRYLTSVSGTPDDIVFPRIDMFINNAAIVAFRGGRVSAAEALDAYKDMPGNADRPLLISNRCALRAAQGDFRDVVDDLRIAFDSLTKPVAKDPFYVYYVGNNLAMAHLGLGNLSAAREVWNSLPEPEIAAPPVSSILRARHDVIEQALALTSASLRDCENRLSEFPSPIKGHGWKHYGHAFLMSELQLWSDE